MMPVSNGAALVGGIALAGVATWQFTVANDAQRQVAELRTQLASRQSSDLGTARRSCSDRSAAYFAKLGYDENGVHDNATTTFQNHYSTRYHRCLMTIETDSFKPPRPMKIKTIFDTDEHTPLGGMNWVASDTRKYWEQPPMTCSMTPPEKPEGTCKSTDEYDAFVKDMLTS